MDKDLTVILGTHNRADYLAKTLDAMAQVDRDGLDVEIVVVNNNGTDNTQTVVESFAQHLPVRYLFEARPGKNCALNLALKEVTLGKLVVFTDDDVVPCQQWFKAMVAASARNPEFSGFGGKIDLVWPEGMEVPGWAHHGWVQGLAYGNHDHGNEEFEYAPTAHAAGANFWVRREVFDDGRVFDESRGPRPGTQFRMGSEASFLLKLAADGYRVKYIPEALVGHHVQPQLLEPDEVIKRAYRMGLGMAYKVGELPRMQLYRRWPTIWKLVQRVGIMRHKIRFALIGLVYSGDQKVLKAARANQDIAYHTESLEITNSGERIANLEGFKLAPKDG